MKIPELDLLPLQILPRIEPMKKPLVLGSSSPSRKRLLDRLGVPFSTASPDVDESHLPGESGEALVMRLSEAKARAVAKDFPDALIIGCDQIATLDGEFLGKPLTNDNAIIQLQKCSGKKVVFHGGICVYNPSTDSVQVSIEPTTVSYRVLSESMIQAYLDLEKPYQCAGSIKVEGLGIALMASVVSRDPNALEGLPVIQLINMLANEGWHVLE